MRPFHFFCGLLGISLLPNYIAATSDGLTKSVTWDPGSLMVDGKRVYILAAEFHYERMPVPEMWLDIFQKFKAEGYNTVNIYFFWSYHSPAKGVFDFTTTGKDIQTMFDYAKQIGLYIIARPGIPHYSADPKTYTDNSSCNAETNAGGLALYLGDGSGGNLRTSDATYHASWTPWIEYVGQLIAANEHPKGGPVILNQVENELQETVHVANNTLVIYMEQLESAFRAAGITIPLSSNEKGQRSESWSTDYQDVGGAVNIYGLDSYPGGLNCNNYNSGFNVVTNYYQWFQNYSISQPKFFPEFEGGWIQGWGASFFDDCASELSYNFADVYYKNNIGQQTTLMSIYMSYGGTNWGNLGAPVVYTSYDYSAPLRETRQIRDKLYQIKLIGLFTRVSTDLLNTQMIGNGTGLPYTNDSTIRTWELRNIGQKAGFYTVLHASSPSQLSTTLTLNVTTSKGSVLLPNINLAGRQAKIVTTDYSFGSHTLLYNTAEVLTYGTFEEDVLVLYLEIGQVGQFTFKSKGASMKYTTYGAVTDLKSANGTYTYTQGSGVTVVQFADGTLFYLMDRVSAYFFHAPVTTSNPNVSPSEHLFVQGPYLVRSAQIANGAINVVGDTNTTTPIEVYVGTSPEADHITWNGNILRTTKTPYGAYTATIAGPENRTITLPSLSAWKVANSLPETDPAYDDSRWTICNKTTTISPVKPVTLPVLYASDYDFATGHKIYRGRFTGTNATFANITAQNGLASGFTVWINGHLAASKPGNASLSTQSAAFAIDRSMLTSGTNVMTVLVDYTGHDETSTARGVENPRGLLGATLTGSSFTSWRIQGQAGGLSSYLDPVRGPLNEGGLYGERLGWHLPGYDASSWSAGSPSTGLNKSGVSWYLTNFTLALDSDLDVPIGLALAAASTMTNTTTSSTTATTPPMSVQLWMNGYQYGKYQPLIGPQTIFPFPPGVINNGDVNTLAIAIWAQSDAGAALSTIELVKYGVYETGFQGGFAQDWQYLQPSWKSGREVYA